ncbi:hypothetical protein HPP92_008606 [Vanilla planifolia]|uniref:GDT1 family protein n=1 Tax=Vanilla planifolia TaxID=51239 RepID=A0A835RC97_VANPL|nr:hypothetical protein HPP92_008794 [Vanilla planifolia]KAG0486511.1 hypothetical protein HPP92_008606 [Vanilla planifolia]
MHSLTLCEVVLGASTSSLYYDKRWKSSSIAPFCYSTSKKRHRWSFKFGDQCYDHENQENKISSESETFPPVALEKKFRSFGGWKTMIQTETKHAYFVMDETQDILEGCCLSSLHAEFHVWHKMAILVCIFSFQACQQAAAAPEFNNGIHPLSFIGDLGDINTGFASALLASRSSWVNIFAGTFGALAVMTIVSVILGQTFHYVDGVLPFRLGDIDFPIDDFAAVCLLVYFGISTLLYAASGDKFRTEEKEEAELAISNLQGDGAGIMAAANTVISTFLLVFVAEWGDKSFFSTIALAAASSPLGVIGGALAGHAFATLLAVLGGSFLGTFVSDKVIAYIGGILFLVFAGVTMFEIIS